MSEHTELIMEGHLCEGCGVFLETRGIDGFPQLCRGCKDDILMAGGTVRKVENGNWQNTTPVNQPKRSYDTPALHDVAKLYRSYDTAYKVAVAAQRLAEELCEDDENQVLVAALNKALDAWVAECSLPRSEMSAAKT